MLAELRKVGLAPTPFDSKVKCLLSDAEGTCDFADGLTVGEFTTSRLPPLGSRLFPAFRTLGRQVVAESVALSLVRPSTLATAYPQLVDSGESFRRAENGQATDLLACQVWSSSAHAVLGDRAKYPRASDDSSIFEPPPRISRRTRKGRPHFEQSTRHGGSST